MIDCLLLAGFFLVRSIGSGQQAGPLRDAPSAAHVSSLLAQDNSAASVQAASGKTNRPAELPSGPRLTLAEAEKLAVANNP